MAIGFTDRAIEIEDHLFGRLSLMDLVDPLAGEIHQRREVALGTERPGLESGDFAGRGGLLLRQRSTPTDNVTHREVDGQSLRVVDVLVARQSAVD